MDRMASILTLRNVLSRPNAVNASSIEASVGIYSTITGSTITSGRFAFSTLIGSSMTTNSVTTSAIGFSTLIGSSMTATHLSVSSMVGSTLLVNEGMIGVNSRNEISGKSAFYFYNNPYMTGGNVAAKTAIITDAVNAYTQSNLHVCLNSTNDLTTSASISDARLSILRTGNVGIGASVPSARLQIGGDATNTIGLQLNEIKIIGNGFSHWSLFGARSGRGHFSIANTSANDAMGTAGTDVLCITSVNNVGIGTADPKAKLDVWGSIYTRSAYEQIGGFIKSYVQVGVVGGMVIGTCNGTSELPTIYITDSAYVGIGSSNRPLNKLDIHTATRTGTHATDRGLYVTTNGSAVSDGMAEFRATNGSQGVGIGFNGIYATGSNTNQDLQLASRGTGTINLLNDVLASGYIRQAGSGKVYCFVTDSTTTFSTWFAFGSTAQANFGSCFNTSTRRFTAPVNGVYSFIFNGLNITESHVGLAFNSDYVDTNLYYTTQQWAIGSDAYARGSWIMYLNANDYVRCIIFQTGTLNVQRTYFAGTLIQAYN